MLKQEMTENSTKITEYTLVDELPDPFLFDDGTRVKTKEDWEKRRAEMHKDVVELQYGTMPPAPEFLEVEPLYLGYPCSYRITTGTKAKPVIFNMIIFKSTVAEKTPMVITGDLCFKYLFDKEYIEAFTKNGIGLVAFNRTELAADIAQYNLNGLMKESGEREMGQKVVDQIVNAEICPGPLKKAYPEYTFGNIGAWAWGYSRCVDALEKLGVADMDMIAFTGHSRGGKACALAGVLDQRAAVVNPNASCSGAYGSYRIKIKAEVDGKIKESEPLSNQFSHFPTWLGAGMKKFVDNEKEIPFDAHHLKAMVAPRTLFVSEAAEDIMANPVGSYQTTEAAEEVFEFLDCPENLIWYFRGGTHYQTVDDVNQLVRVIRHKKYGEPLGDDFFKLPFKKLKPAYSWKAPEKK